MTNTEKLYFIAIIPHATLCDKIKSFKESIKLKYQAKYALKSPAHITLQKPFKFNEESESILIDTLTKFASSQNPFSVELKNFDQFIQRVIYIKIVNHNPIKILHKHLMLTLKSKLDFNEKALLKNVHPHITIANRDLKSQNFKNAWQEYQLKKFNASFKVNSIFLLKHNGKYWDIFKAFKFNIKYF